MRVQAVASRPFHVHEGHGRINEGNSRRPGLEVARVFRAGTEDMGTLLFEAMERFASNLAPAFVISDLGEASYYMGCRILLYSMAEEARTGLSHVHVKHRG